MGFSRTRLACVVAALWASTSPATAETMRIISTAPARVVSPDSITAAFSGDWSHGDGEGYKISGDALGRPRGGYLVESEAAWKFVYITNTSGWNQALDGNDGRTAAVGLDFKLDNLGQGDVIPFFAQCFVPSTRSGATNYLASPECGIIGGGMFAGANGVYLDADEINCDDHGFDAACAGMVRNFRRTNDKGLISAWWVGVRLLVQWLERCGRRAQHAARLDDRGHELRAHQDVGGGGRRARPRRRRRTRGGGRRGCGARLRARSRVR
jgi:hypothetical protein